MDDRIWRLAGPRRFIREVAEQNRRGRHVAVVVPAYLLADEGFTGGLAGELIDEIRDNGDPTRVHRDPDSDGLITTILRAMGYDDAGPATVPELLLHPEARGRTAVMVASDLPEQQGDEIASLLERLEVESRAVAATERLSIVAILDHGHLPRFPGGETSDVTVATSWWWNRISRWDVASYVLDVDPNGAGVRVLSDVRTETIVEVAKWDLALADELAVKWLGDLAELAAHLSDRAPVSDCGASGRCGDRPTDDIVSLWSDGALDGWHDSHAPALAGPGIVKKRLERVVWSAQARILLPWIEERRAEVERLAIERMGKHRFGAALEQLDPPIHNDDVVEIGQLKYIIDVRVGDSDVALRNAVRRLTSARNRLAHLEPISLATLNELVAACQFMG